MNTNAVLLPSGAELIQSIQERLVSADEAIMIMARISISGLGQLKKALLERKKLKKPTTIILGVDMISPSSPEAIKFLFQLHDGRDFKLLCYNGSSFFHPKFYAFRERSRWDFVIGSSNLTEEGLSKNIELNILLTNASKKDEFVRAFHENYAGILDASKEFSQKQIQIMIDNIPEIQKRTKGLKKSIAKVSESIKRRQEIELSKWDRLVREIKKFKGSKDYQDRLRRIPAATRECKKAIGSDPRKPRVSAELWNDREVGYFSNLNNMSYFRTKLTTKRKIARMNKVLKHLLNNTIPIEKRLDDILRNGGEYHIKGMGISHLSDILVKYYPKDYMLLNEPILKALRFYGMRHIPADPVERYMVALEVYKKMREASNYPERNAYLLLDQFMWVRGHKLLYGWS